MNKLRRVCLTLSALSTGLVVSACSTEQTYNSLKGYQRNECNKRVDNAERERCLKEADTSYGEYKKQTSAP